MRKITILLFAVVAANCATNPATGKRELMLVSESQEIQMGREADADVRKTMGVYEDAAWQAYVTNVGMKLAKASHRPNLPWKFTVVDEPAVNAFALPGGFIYITRGILPYLRDEAELAAVLGHEVGHVDARHSASQMSKQQVAGLGIALGGVLAPKYGTVFDVITVSMMRSRFARRDEPVSVTSTIASARSGGFTSVAPHENSTRTSIPLSEKYRSATFTSSVAMVLPRRSSGVRYGESSGTASTQRTRPKLCLA